MLSQIGKVNRYYDASFFDYHTMWTGRNDLAIHFGYYDRQVRFHSQALLNMNKALADRAGITRKDCVLDAGCGYGGSAIWLAENIGCTVVGVNVVPFQIKRAARYAEKRGVSNLVSFIEADYAETHLPDSSFTVVWGLESIVHAPDKAKLVHEAYRLLRTGGRIILAEYTLRETPALTNDERSSLQPWLDGWAMPSLLEAGEYKLLLSNAGFKNVQVENITNYVLPSLKRLERLLTFGVPVGRFLSTIGLFSLEHLGNIEGSRTQSRALKKGLWQYSIITGEKC